MRKLLYHILLLLATFAMGKGLFILYNKEQGVTPTDFLEVWRHGLGMDISVACYLLVIPWLLLLLYSRWPRIPLGRILLPYHILTATAVALALVADILLYPFWQYKLDYSVLSYLHSPEGVTSSVSGLFILGSVIAVVIVAVLLTLGQQCLYRRVQQRPHWIFYLLPIALFIGIRGGVQEGTMNVGTAYYSPRLFLNHAAVNPVFSFLYSASKAGSQQEAYHFLSDDEAQAAFQGLYPEKSPENPGALENPNSLLRTQRPQIIIVQLEGMCARFLSELGGLPDVCPNLSRYIPEGVFFDQCYANSYRTDRGTLSALSGHISYPTLSLMKYPALYQRLPSLARTLAAAGYSTRYTYGGDITFMGTQGYLLATGFQELVSEEDFSLREANASKWGVRDSLVLQRALHDFRSVRLHMVQTLDSHEPFEVPYQRLQDKVQNAFAYTDHCLGQFLDSLKATPEWQNLLVIIWSDHGVMYQQNYESPEFFHIPMLWVGGALRDPRRISTLMNQSDIAATLLAQLGLSHDDFPWSRDILSADYRYPFAYSTFPSGIMWRDSTGITLYDISAQRVIHSAPQQGTAQRIRRAQAVLQFSTQNLKL